MGQINLRKETEIARERGGGGRRTQLRKTRGMRRINVYIQMLKMTYS